MSSDLSLIVTYLFYEEGNQKWSLHYAILKFHLQPNLHWTQVISSHHTIFAPVQKVKIAFTKFKFYKKVQGFIETLQIMSFQNVW